jgi:hypothetical protein
MRSYGSRVRRDGRRSGSEFENKGVDSFIAQYDHVCDASGVVAGGG